MRYAFILLALLAVPAAAEDAAIIAPDTVEVGQLVQLHVEGIPLDAIPSAVVDWQPKGSVNVFPAQTWGGKPVIFFQANDAADQAIWIAYDRDEPGPGYCRVDFTVEGDDRPDPRPDPEPEPDPDPPTPPLEDLFVMILEETDDRAGGLDGAELNEHIEEVANYLGDLGVSYQLRDDDDPAAKAWMELLAGKEVPALVVSVPSQGNRLIGAESFGSDAGSTIQRLKGMGVTK